LNEVQVMQLNTKNVMHKMRLKYADAWIVATILLFFQTSGAQSNILSKKPNVVIIFMDDMGYGDPGCYNGLLYQTPQVDKLAAQGMRFTNFYVAQAVCSASRAGLLTGCYPNRLGINGALFPWSTIALNPKEETIATSLKRIGYATGIVGKWHLGCKSPYLPTNFGFDEFYGLPYSNDMWPVDFDGSPVRDTNNFRFRFPPLQLLEGDKATGKYIQTLDDQGTLTKSFTERAVQFIKKNKQRPFFLYLAHSMVHIPLGASPEFRGKSKDGLFGDVMMEVDWSVGQVMKALDESGLTQNTIVVFTSDNGPWLVFGNHAGNTGGLREGKGTSWEGGQRVPCIIRWPAQIPAGTVCNNLASTIDLFPTLAEICGSPLPKQKIDGVSILPLLLNRKDANPRDEFVYYYQRNSLEAVRKGQWKLVFPHRYVTFNQDSIGSNGFRAEYRMDSTGLALFDLRTDPGEDRDVKSVYPQIVKELQAVAEKYRQALGDDLTKTPCKECREPAKVDQ
jgi:arylsulfatase A-like enzyme